MKIKAKFYVSRVVILMVMFAVFTPFVSAQIEKVQLMSHEEMQLRPEDILHLPGIGLGMRCQGDSIMLLDDPSLSRLGFREPNAARSLVGVRSGIYAAEGDSIRRLATDSLPSQFVGRMDNEQFTLHAATDSTFYVCTADEEFSCVDEINPEDGVCYPVISIEGPILGISGNGAGTMLWVDDTVMRLDSEGNAAIVYQADNITGMVLTPMGVMISTTDGIWWLTGPDTGAQIERGGVKALWWDGTDALYYLTSEGDLVAVVGMLERFMEISKVSKRL